MSEWELGTGDPATTLSGTEKVPILQGGQPRAASTAQFAAMLGSPVLTLTGDVGGTGTGTISVSIGSHKVTMGKLIAAPSAGLLGAAGAGDYQHVTLGTGLVMSVGGILSTSGGGATLGDGDYGDVVVSSAGTVLTIDNHAVSFPKLLSASSPGLIGASASGNYGHLALGTGISIVAGALTATASFDAEATRDTIAAALIAGTGISITPNDGGDTITITSTVTSIDAEAVRDTIGATLVGGTGITVSVNDVSDTITIAATGGTGTPLTAEDVRDTIGATLVAGGGIGIVVNDGLDTITITATGTFINVASRTALAAIVGPSNGDIRWLAEAGREGWFKFSTANLSTNVSADPYQGLYVPPTAATSGSSGAWVRVITNTTYFASWWGVSSSGTTNDLQLTTIGFLLPSGAALWLPGSNVPISGRFWFYNVVHLRGWPNSTRIVNTGNPSSYMIGFGVAGCTVEGISFDGNRTTGNQGTRPWLVPADGVGGLTVRKCNFYNSSLCIIAYGTGVAGGGGYTRCAPLIVEDCYFETDYQATSFFGVSSGAFRRNTVRPAASPYTGRFVPCVRVLGSTNVVIEDNDIQGFSTTKLDMFGIELSLCQDGNNNRPQSRDIMIRRNLITNCFQPIRIDEARGLTSITNNTFRNGITTDITGASTAIMVSTGVTVDSVMSAADRIEVANNRAEGFFQFFGCDGASDHVRIVDNVHVASNYDTTDAAFDGPVIRMGIGLSGKGEIARNRFEGKQRFNSRPISIAATGTVFFEIYDNAFPEEDPANSTRFNTWLFFGDSPSTCKVYNSRGGTLFASGTPGSNQILSGLGDNWRTPYGSYAALIT
jgi:hypothetical protein